MEKMSGGWVCENLPIVSVYITLLQGHFYLLCTVMVIAGPWEGQTVLFIANLVQGDLPCPAFPPLPPLTQPCIIKRGGLIIQMAAYK